MLPSGLLSIAIAYTLKQWDKLVMYLKSPYLTPDNNDCENLIRPFVLGRKTGCLTRALKVQKVPAEYIRSLKRQKRMGLNL